MKRLIIAAVLAGAMASTAGTAGTASAEPVVTYSHCHPLYCVAHKHGQRVFVDVSGNGWKSKHDAKHESRRLLRWLASLDYTSAY